MLTRSGQVQFLRSQSSIEGAEYNSGGCERVKRDKSVSDLIPSTVQSRGGTVSNYPEVSQVKLPVTLSSNNTPDTT